MKRLHLGDSGPDVRELQTKLIAAGYSLQADAHFGIATDQALRAFQRKRGLLPDGIAGAKTQTALDSRDDGTANALLDSLRGLFGAPSMLAALHARNHVPFLRGAALASGTLKTSRNGMLFIYREEAQKNVSNVLHWPVGDASGVTLGPGYDMGGRSKEEIIADLKAIGIPQEAAAKAAEGAGLKGKQAQAFVAKFNKENPDLIKIEKEKDEFALLKHVLPRYEKYVKNAVHVDLHQHEFDALVSFSWNIGTILITGGHINRGEVRLALEVIQSCNKSKGEVLPGLTGRRRREIALYRSADYGTLPKIG